MGRRVVVAELIYRTSYTKEVSSIIGFFNIHLKTFSRYDNLEVVRLFLAQGGNILETFPGPRGRSGVGGGGVLPTMAYTWRLRPKGIPYLAFMYIKGWGFTS